MKKLTAILLIVCALISLSAHSLAEGAQTLFSFWDAPPGSPPDVFVTRAWEAAGLVFERKEALQFSYDGDTYIPYTAALDDESPSMFGHPFTQAIATFRAGADGTEALFSLEIYFSFASPLAQLLTRVDAVFLALSGLCGPITDGYSLVGSAAKYDAPVQGSGLDGDLLRRILTENRQSSGVSFVWGNIQYSLTCMLNSYSDMILVSNEAIPPDTTLQSLGSYASVVPAPTSGR